MKAVNDFVEQRSDDLRLSFLRALQDAAKTACPVGKTKPEVFALIPKLIEQVLVTLVSRVGDWVEQDAERKPW
ncbi:MAG: hypothetical protein V3W41_05005 [Planctomycetota bacterium]